MTENSKQRLTAFIDPALVTRAKVRGALEGFTISEVVEKALDAYAPKIEKTSDKQLNVKFTNDSILIVPKHTKGLVVPR